MGACCTKNKNTKNEPKQIDFGTDFDVNISKAGKFQSDIHQFYYFHRVIGTGYFGNVYLGQYKNENTET
jgi:hypothetical protein